MSSISFDLLDLPPLAAFGIPGPSPSGYDGGGRNDHAHVHGLRWRARAVEAQSHRSPDSRHRRKPRSISRAGGRGADDSASYGLRARSRLRVGLHALAQRRNSTREYHKGDAANSRLLYLLLLLLLLVLFLILLFIFLLCASRLSTRQSKMDRPPGPRLARSDELLLQAAYHD